MEEVLGAAGQPVGVGAKLGLPTLREPSNPVQLRGADPNLRPRHTRKEDCRAYPEKQDSLPSFHLYCLLPNLLTLFEKAP